MKIGELARLSGVAASRIRFYEASGLLQPAQRQANGYREYAPDTLTRLEIIALKLCGNARRQFSNFAPSQLGSAVGKRGLSSLFRAPSAD